MGVVGDMTFELDSSSNLHYFSELEGELNILSQMK